jgi:quercetin dioxygenase-like cupin family protein
MIIGHEKDVLGITMNSPDVKGAVMKALIGPDEGWQDHVMRVVELESGGYSPKHAHPWPHINYVLEGSGALYFEGKDNPVAAGSYAYVPAGQEHQYKNTGDGIFRFICIVPKEGHIT